MSALSVLNGGCPSPPNPPAGHLFRFFKRAADRARGDIPYKERNSENLQIAQCERKQEEKKLLSFLRGGNNCCNYGVVILSSVRNCGGGYWNGVGQKQKRSHLKSAMGRGQEKREVLNTSFGSLYVLENCL